jgi:7-keto-8-aminopelargonate synthetase-like enzyme
VHTIPHNDLEAIQRALGGLSSEQRVLIVVDGVYSMDGDLCPLPELVTLKDRAGALLLVDEAHALGVIGATGRGLHEFFGLAGDAVDVWTGSLSKAIPATGGYVAGSAAMIRYLQHAAPPYWFSAALGPPAAGAALAALQLMGREPNRLERLTHTTSKLRAGLQALGFDTGASRSAIIPVIVGSSRSAWEFARALFNSGIIASPIVHPAVPKHGARLRLCATAALEDSNVAIVLEEFAVLADQFVA